MQHTILKPKELKGSELNLLQQWFLSGGSGRTSFSQININLLKQYKKHVFCH